MSQYDHQVDAPDAAAAYPPAPTSYPAGQYVMAPPPIGYPTRDAGSQQETVPTDTTTRGDGFLKGCLAGLCCCWCLDCCF